MNPAPSAPEPTSTFFGWLPIVLLVAVVVFGLLAASHRWSGVDAAAGNPSGSWVGLVNVRFSDDGEPPAKTIPGVGNAALHLELRHSWFPLSTTYAGSGELCDAGGTKRHFELYRGSFKDPEQFVANLRTQSPLGAVISGHYSNTQIVITTLNDYEFKMTGTLGKADAAAFASACDALRTHGNFHADSPYTVR